MREGVCVIARIGSSASPLLWGAPEPRPGHRVNRYARVEALGESEFPSGRPNSGAAARMVGHARPLCPAWPLISGFSNPGLLLLRPDHQAATRTRRSACKMEAKAGGAPAPRNSLCPSRLGTGGPAARLTGPALQTGKDRKTRGRAIQDGAAQSCSADSSTPAHAGHYLPRLGRCGRPNPARSGAHGPSNPMRRPNG